ncbi:MAG: hypothetical protein L0211_21685 [Planctomycetaceae bacterium]|nr:hypothetical protein [Planctomycetaceae bacterium]
MCRLLAAGAATARHLLRDYRNPAKKPGRDVRILACDAGMITGQALVVDGGRTV